MLDFVPHSRADIKLRVKWLNDPKANEFAVDDPSEPTTEEKETAWFDAYEKAGDAKNFFTILLDRRPIGLAGITVKEPGQGEVFVMIGETDCWGKGYGTEAVKFLMSQAFGEMGLQRLVADVNKENHASLTLFSGLGFRPKEGDDPRLLRFVLDRP